MESQAEYCRDLLFLLDFVTQCVCVCVCCFADSMDGCSSDCNGNGECVAGHCHCFAGFLGPECAKGRKCTYRWACYHFISCFFFHSFIAVKSYEKAQHAHCCWTCSSRFNIVILTSIIKKRKLIEFGLMWKLIWTPSKTCLQLNPGVVHYVNTDCKPHCNKKVEKLR